MSRLGIAETRGICACRYLIHRHLPSIRSYTVQNPRQPTDQLVLLNSLPASVNESSVHLSQLVLPGMVDRG